MLHPMIIITPDLHALGFDVPQDDDPFGEDIDAEEAWSVLTQAAAEQAHVPPGQNAEFPWAVYDDPFGARYVMHVGDEGMYT